MTRIWSRAQEGPTHHEHIIAWLFQALRVHRTILDVSTPNPILIQNENSHVRFQKFERTRLFNMSAPPKPSNQHRSCADTSNPCWQACPGADHRHRPGCGHTAPAIAYWETFGNFKSRLRSRACKIRSHGTFLNRHGDSEWRIPQECD